MKKSARHWCFTEPSSTGIVADYWIFLLCWVVGDGYEWANLSSLLSYFTYRYTLDGTWCQLTTYPHSSCPSPAGLVICIIMNNDVITTHGVWGGETTCLIGRSEDVHKCYRTKIHRLGAEGRRGDGRLPSPS